MTINLIKAEQQYDQLRAECRDIWADVPLTEQAAVYQAVLSGNDDLIRAVPTALVRLALHLLICGAALDTERQKQTEAASAE